MTVFNCTPHDIDVYLEQSFAGLVQQNPTTWVADSVSEGEIIQCYKPSGLVRIAVKTIDDEPLVTDRGDIPMVATSYGELEGVPEDFNPETDLMIVSLPAQSMAKASGHPYASRMVAPYKVVRDAANTSKVLGCMGFTY